MLIPDAQVTAHAVKPAVLRADSSCACQVIGPEGGIQSATEEPRSAVCLLYNAVQETIAMPEPKADGRPGKLTCFEWLGQTYVYNVMCGLVRIAGEIVLAVASSGRAARLLQGGQQARKTSRFLSLCTVGSSAG